MKLPVLVYQKLHTTLKDQYTTAVEDFRWQLMFLKEKGYTSISCQQLYQHLMGVGKLPLKPVLITFDQGHISQHTYAKDILKEYDFNAIFFVLGDCVLNSSFKEKGFLGEKMDIDHLASLLKSGFEVGFHGFEKLNYEDAQLTDIQNDIQKCIRLFKKLDLNLTNALAFPHTLSRGRYWNLKKMKKVLCHEKVLVAFKNTDRVNDLARTDRFNISRIEVKGGTTENLFLKMISKKTGWF